MLELRKGPPASTVLDALKALEEKWKRPVLIVLTGGIAEDSLQCLLVDGHLPTFITAYLKTAQYNHAFYCLSQNSTITKTMLAGKGLAGFVSIIEDAPLAMLNEWFKDVKLGLAILDTNVDPADALAEYKAVENRIEEGGIVIIDDVDPDSKVTKKGSLIVPYLHETKRGYQFDNGMLKVFF